MIIRLTLLAILQVLQFRKLKELQLSYLQDIILRKQARLKSIIDRLSAEIRLNEVLSQSDINSPSLSKAITDLKSKRARLPSATQRNLHNSTLLSFDQATEEDLFIKNYNNGLNLHQQSQHWGKAIAGTSSSAASITSSARNSVMSVSSIGTSGVASDMLHHQKSVSKLSIPEINEEILKLHLELNDKLTPCFNSLLDDVKFISVNVEKNVNLELVKVVNKLSLIMYHWKTDVFGEFSSSCQKIWANEK
ncbi:unnamed protein product [Ambrosiozyma monospora]|uniref:Unnamed protein product n=1 Tax=Ambrosiozyma monospora TaxID=43982 RepID=A0ACB5SU28_AMBMO|nr:unnamed protein product [Ambrosiozyma monospora]